MVAPLFNRPESCNVEAVPSLDFNFVSECSVAGPPPPIYDCPVPIIPRDPPLPPCPEFSTTVRVNAGYAGCSSVASEPGGTLLFTRVDTNPCRFLVDLDLDIPIPQPPCPDILGGSVDVKVAYTTPGGSCSLPESRIRVTKTVRDTLCASNSAACEYVIDLDLNIPIPPPPCPDITAGSVRLTTGYENCVGSAAAALTVHKDIFPGNCSEAPSCAFTIDLDLTIPVPTPPCPKIEGGSVALNVAYQDPDGTCSLPESRIRVTKNTLPLDCSGSVNSSAAACEFIIDLDLNIPIPLPPCPKLEAGSVSVKTGYEECVGPAAGSLAIHRNVFTGNCSEAPSCDFTIDLDLTIPIPKPPCPAIKEGQVDVTVGYADCTAGPTGALTITKEVIPGNCLNGQADSCQFTIDLALDIPIPQPPCPEILEGTVDVNVGYANCTAGPGGTLTITKEVIPGDCAAGQADTCQFTIDLNLDVPIPPPPCPEIVEGAVAVRVNYAGCGVGPGGAFTITKEVIPGDCGAGEADTCQFTIDLDLDIPVPRPTCPTINLRGNVISDRDAQIPPGLYITPNHLIRPPDCNTNDPGECAFDFVLDIVTPSFCPEIQRGNSYFTWLPYGAAPNVYIQPQVDTATCTFWLDLILNIPKPAPDPQCPVFYTENAVTIYETNDFPGGELTIIGRPQYDIADPCEYDVALNLRVRPGSRVYPRDVTCAWTTCGADPSCLFTISEPDAAGNQYADLAIYIPRPPEYYGGQINLGAYGSGQITITSPDNTGCLNTIGANITLSTTACDNNGGGGGGYQPGIGP